jgi:peptide/nickel transport system substrate-binding protein
VKLVPREQAALIDDAISRNYEAMTFRNYPGGDPDINYVWWYGKGNPVNFGGWDDEVVNDLLDRGRSETDPEKRQKIYQDLDRRMAEQVHGLWSSYTPWAIATSESVHGVYGPALPTDDLSEQIPMSSEDPARQPSRGLATGHSLIGLWVED